MLDEENEGHFKMPNYETKHIDLPLDAVATNKTEQYVSAQNIVKQNHENEEFPKPFIFLNYTRNC